MAQDEDLSSALVQRMNFEDSSIFSAIIDEIIALVNQRESEQKKRDEKTTKYLLPRNPIHFI